VSVIGLLVVGAAHKINNFIEILLFKMVATGSVLFLPSPCQRANKPRELQFYL
jgi:hypothetical protein